MSAFLKNRIMTDKTSLTIPLIEFFKAGGTLKNCKPITKKRYIAYPEETNNEVNKFKWRVVEELYLPNPRGMHNFRVTIEEKCRTRRLKVEGSIRKWIYGKTSLEDTSRNQIPIFVKELADSLCLSEEFVWNKLKISNTELGYNFTTNLCWKDIVRHCVQYGRTKDRIDYDNKNDCLYWNGDDKSLKMYNKSEEMPANIRNRTRKIEAEKIVSSLAKRGQTLCRIEVTLDDKNSFKKYGLSEICTLRDIYENWDKLHALLVKEIAKIRIESKVHISERMTPRQQEIAKQINSSPSFDIAAEKISKMYYHSDKNRAKREMFVVMSNFSSPKHCSIRTFRKAIAKRLTFIDRNREKLPLSDLFHILWRTSKGRKLKLRTV